MKNRRFTMTVLLCILSLLFCALLSVAYGSKAVSFQTVFRSLFHFASDSFDASVVQARIPRTVFGILAGAALAVSGSVMQAVTRNPIADPSILGVNTGASLFVVCGIAFFHISSGNQYIWLAFAGASITAVLVYGLASAGHEGATPVKLALAGAAWSDIRLLLPYFLTGFILCIFLASSLNTLALGDEAATGLGLNVPLIRAVSTVASVLLCASTTALAGPISFIGLMIPHLVRLLLGSDMRRIIPVSAVCGSCLLLISDVLGRVLGRPGELESGIITTLIGAPVFVFIIRKVKVRSL